jgi:hypothetical protein
MSSLPCGVDDVANVLELASLDTFELHPGFGMPRARRARCANSQQERLNLLRRKVLGKLDDERGRIHDA